AGYMYVYISNEGEELVDVFFDDLKVTHTKSPVVQTNDYYPFGFTFNSYQREDATPNRYKFQGQEHIDDLDLAWDSFKWRNHQPDIGRFFNIDPLADKYVYNSPYAFSENKVVAHVELEGLEALSIQFEVRGVVSGEVAGVTTSQTVGVVVGRSSNAEGMQVTTFYTPTLGVAAGQGLTAGVSTSFYPTASIEDLGGFGGAAGYFLTANPAGAGPVMSGEVNTTDPSGNPKLGGTLGINPVSVGMGGGVYAELSYTFLGDLVNIEDLAPDHPLVKDLAKKFGVSEETIIGGVGSMVKELFNQVENSSEQQESQNQRDQRKENNKAEEEDKDR